MRVVISILIGLLAAGVLPAQGVENNDIVVLSGRVIDRKSHKGLDNVSVSVPGTNVGTVTNDAGDFSLKISKENVKSGLKAEYPGYRSAVIAGGDISPSNEKNLTISMVSAARMLQEVIVRGGDPKEIVASALRKIPDNYSSEKNLFSAFYRETIRKGRKFIGVSEAVMDVYKTPYDHRKTYGDKVQVMKGRRLLNQKSDTLVVKMAGGPTLPVLLDFVKNEDFLFTEEELDLYEFRMQQPTSIDDRMQYVIAFKPRTKVNYALYEGTLYIDQETLSFSRAEFNVDMSDKDKATRAILRKKPKGLHFKPQEISFSVSYKDCDGKTYLNYISTRTRFKCDWKRRLFSSGYTAFAEVVMVDRTDNPASGISRRQAFGRNDIFDDNVEDYWDEDFWRDYNIIEPTESLEKAVKRLKSSGGRQESLGLPAGYGDVAADLTE